MKIELRGGARQLFASREQEVILAGPADTGKTMAACVKCHTICSLIPNVQGAIVRKTAESLAGTVVKTFRRIIANSPVQVYGGESPQRFIYPNGSQIWLGGLNKPERVL